jgi:hypothetical protein
MKSETYVYAPRNDKEAQDERTKQAVRTRMNVARALIKNPAHDTGSRPAMAGQTYEPPVQHLAAFLRR